MATYVTSLHPRARLSHIGSAHVTACGFVPIRHFRVTETVPSGFTVCPRCANTPARTALSLVRFDPALRDAALVALLKKGLGNDALARRLGWSQRSVVRHVNEAMRRAGARSRFEWGYNVGRAERP